MSDCCCPESADQSTTPPSTNLCPQCGNPGKRVQLITLKSLLVPSALEKVDSTGRHHFCKDAGCPVVYFSEQGHTFTTDDVQVPIFQKDDREDVPVCYCFGWSRQRIRDAQMQAEPSQVVDSITAHIKAGRCGCEVNNPQGSCCLGNVRSYLEHVQTEYLQS